MDSEQSEHPIKKRAKHTIKKIFPHHRRKRPFRDSYLLVLARLSWDRKDDHRVSDKRWMDSTLCGEVRFLVCVTWSNTRRHAHRANHCCQMPFADDLPPGQAMGVARRRQGRVLTELSAKHKELLYALFQNFLAKKIRGNFILRIRSKVH